MIAVDFTHILLGQYYKHSSSEGRSPGLADRMIASLMFEQALPVVISPDKPQKKRPESIDVGKKCRLHAVCKLMLCSQTDKTVLGKDGSSVGKGLGISRGNPQKKRPKGIDGGEKYRLHAHVLCNALLCSQPNRTVLRKDGTSAGKRLGPSRWQAQVCEMVMKKKGFAAGKK